MSREKPKPKEGAHGGGRPGSAGEGQEPPARAAAYIPPMAVPKESRYHTIDMKAVRLSPDIDPKRMKTQLSLRAIQAATVKPPSRLPAWIALLCMGGAVGTGAWWFLRWNAARDEFATSSVSATQEAAVALATGAREPSVLVVEAEPAATLSASSSSASSSSASSSPNVGQTTERLGAVPPVVALAGSSPSSLPTTASPAARAPRQRPRATTRVNAAPRSATTSAPGPGPEAAGSAPSQPKLWLE